MQPGQDVVEPEFEPPAHGAAAIFQPFPQYAAQILDPRAAIQPDDIEIDAIAAFQIGGGVKVQHQGLGINPPGARDQDQPHRMFMVRFIAQIREQRQFSGLHLGADLLQDTAARALIRQRGDHDIARFPLPDRAQPDGAVAALVHGPDGGLWGDDLGPGREVRPLDILAEFGGRGLGHGQQAHAGRGDFPQIMRRDIGRHAHGDAGGAVQQDIGQARGQARGLFERAVEVRVPVHGALADLAQQQIGIAREPRFGIAHRGEGFGVIH